MAQQSGSSNLIFAKVNPRGKLVGSKQKVMIINLYKQIREVKLTLLYREMVKAISQRTGIDQLTISKTLSEYKKRGHITFPNRMRCRLKINEKISEEDKLAIRRKIYEFWFRREMPNLNKVFMAINNDKDLPTFSKSTLYRLLKKIDFKFVDSSRNSALIDKDYICSWRQKYLVDIKRYHEEGCQIYYVGGMRVNARDCTQKIFVDKTNACIEDATKTHLSTSVPNRTGKGRQFIVEHIGSLDGFVPGTILVLQSKNNFASDHEEMNGDTFFTWFRGILPRLKEKSIIVMNHMPYNSMKVENYPTMSWKVYDVIKWLLSKGEKVPADAAKITLVNLAKKHKRPDNNYLIDVYAKQQGHTVLRIPPFHRGLNPTELVWEMVKDDVKARNTTHKVADVEQLLNTSIESVPVETWKNFIRHTKNEETRLLQLDHIMDDLIDEDGNWEEVSDTVDILEIEEEHI